MIDLKKKDGLMSKSQVVTWINNECNVPAASDRLIDLFFGKQQETESEGGCFFIPRVPLESVKDVFKRGGFSDLAKKTQKAKNAQDAETREEIWMTASSFAMRQLMLLGAFGKVESQNEKGRGTTLDEILT